MALAEVRDGAAGRARGDAAQEPRGSREALDVLAGAGCAAAAAARARRSTDSCWPATGSTPACRRRSSRRSISGHLRACGQAHADRQITGSPDDLRPRPLLGGRAQGQEPLVVRRPPGAQPSRRARRAARQGSAHADRPHRDRARPGRRRWPKCAIACRACSASPTTRWRPACRSTSKAWPRRSCRSCRRRKRPSSFRVLVRRADSEVPDAVARSGARSRIAGVDRARLEGRSRSCRPGDPRRDHSRRRVLLHRPRAGPRRIADRHGGRLVGAAVRRHRFAGGGVAHDEARLPRHARALPQRAVPVERVAGEGAAARGSADALPVAHRSCIWCRSASCSGRSR